MNGAKSVLEELYNNERSWSEVLSKISEGDAEWLSIANELKNVSDSGASNQLENAVGEALSSSPVNVLTISAPGFSLGQVCSGPDIDDMRFDSYEKSNQEIDKRIAMLQTVTEQELFSEAGKCIEMLKQSKRRIADFYGVKSK